MMPENNTTSGKLDKIRRNFNELYGAPIKDSAKSDVFLQFDYAFGVPKNTRAVLVKHDLIPYVFWNSFFESAWVPFKNKALRTTLRTIFANHKYKQILRRSLKNAGLIISVSESTKKDIQRYFKVPESKAIVAHLGVDMAPAKTNQTDSAEHLPTKPYLLFIGAGDARRRVDDLVTAFNNLKADGHDIQLVLVGENFKAPEAIPNTNVRKAVLESSYKNDILTLGYVDDITKQKLYRDAVAFVYPTKYEGFGIPVLEAMLLECPIITYKNSSIPEVGGKHALYANNWMDIQKRTEELLKESTKVRQQRLQLAKAHAEQFTWDKTATIIYEELTR
jgi:glycosyltransferase involved in cell wall biosynthesis